MPRLRSRVGTLHTFLIGWALLLALTPAARAQDGDAQAAPPPAHIARVDGVATVERDGQSQPATPNAPFVPGDRLRTTAGRVEVLFPDGTALDVDQDSGVDLQSPTLLRLVSGRIMLVVSGASDPAAATRYQIDTPVASAETAGAGEYRVAVLNGRDGVYTELAVFRGSATLATERGATPVQAGERSVARDNEAPSYAQAFNSARFDAFDRWSAAERDARTASTSSSQYLPQDLQMYGGTLDRNGSWEYAAPYGYAWYPNVAPDWQPYYYGAWAPYQPWGWTWIGADVWAWPTHHYGRWGFARSRWFWVPGRTWGPAWVSWASAPGYVSWCPLGFDGRPVFALSFGAASRWAGWTVVPRMSFGGFRARVDRFALPPHRIPVVATAFVTHHTAPVDVPRTAPRVVFPPTRAAGTAVPRSTGGVRPQPEARTPATATPRDFKRPLPDTFGGRERGPYTAHARPAPSPSATSAAPRATPPARAVPARAYPAPAPPPARVERPPAPPPARVDRPPAPLPAHVDRPSAPPPSRGERPPPPARTPAAAAPRSAPAPSKAPPAGGSRGEAHKR